ncbi:C-terminal binding protein [Thermoactinospora rubra]|uniref:C-terminal binding protein n=1 Tax=Thermoactinospora rubra TaxID=1088767 RepID=UPI000A122C20|nr:C-terminal binding protein [Thermoactinospora rubra]
MISNAVNARLGTVVITDCDHGTIAPEESVLRGQGVSLRLAACKTPEDVADQAADADVLINQYVPITGPVLDALPRCRLVVRYGVGVDNVDVAAATERGVWVANVPDYGVGEVADHTIALAMSLLRGIASLDRAVREGRWDYRVARPLRRLGTLTFGVVGCGAIGTAAGRRAAALGLRVIGADPLAARPGQDGSVIEKVPLEDLLASADVVSLHATLAAGSRHLIGAPQLAAMKPTAYLVNTARGGLVDTAALLDALDRGRIAGAALDVLEAEPPDEIGRALARHDRVVMTPHAAWYSEEAFHTLKTEVAREALRVLRGERPRCPVNEPKAVRA